jgi:hypothetical protein
VLKIVPRRWVSISCADTYPADLYCSSAMSDGIRITADIEMSMRKKMESRLDENAFSS